MTLLPGGQPTVPGLFSNSLANVPRQPAPEPQVEAGAPATAQGIAQVAQNSAAEQNAAAQTQQTMQGQDPVAAGGQPAAPQQPAPQGLPPMTQPVNMFRASVVDRVPDAVPASQLSADAKFAQHFTRACEELGRKAAAVSMTGEGCHKAKSTKVDYGEDVDLSNWSRTKRVDSRLPPGGSSQSLFKRSDAVDAVQGGRSAHPSASAFFLPSLPNVTEFLHDNPLTRGVQSLVSRFGGPPGMQPARAPVDPALRVQPAPQPYPNPLLQNVPPQNTYYQAGRAPTHLPSLEEDLAAVGRSEATAVPPPPAAAPSYPGSSPHDSSLGLGNSPVPARMPSPEAAAQIPPEALGVNSPPPQPSPSQPSPPTAAAPSQPTFTAPVEAMLQGNPSLREHFINPTTGQPYSPAAQRQIRSNIMYRGAPGAGHELNQAMAVGPSAYRAKIEDAQQAAAQTRKPVASPAAMAANTTPHYGYNQPRGWDMQHQRNLNAVAGMGGGGSGNYTVRSSPAQLAQRAQQHVQGLLQAPTPTLGAMAARGVMPRSVGAMQHTQALRNGQMPQLARPGGVPVMGKAGGDLSPFAQAFLSRCEERGLTAPQIQAAATKLASLDAEVAQELEPLTKEAFLQYLGPAASALSKAGPWLAKGMNLGKTVGKGAWNVARPALSAGAAGMSADYLTRQLSEDGQGTNLALPAAAAGAAKGLLNATPAGRAISQGIGNRLPGLISKPLAWAGRQVGAYGPRVGLGLDAAAAGVAGIQAGDRGLMAAAKRYGGAAGDAAAQGARSSLGISEGLDLKQIPEKLMGYWHSLPPEARWGIGLGGGALAAGGLAHTLGLMRPSTAVGMGLLGGAAGAALGHGQPGALSFGDGLQSQVSQALGHAANQGYAGPTVSTPVPLPGEGNLSAVTSRADEWRQAVMREALRQGVAGGQAAGYATPFPAGQ